ncbi:cell growth defect factor 2 [Musa troglodytarum]|uniref:Cell growth defect factor 2 n=1 Tax=Musa troglodytarum TaxID=320322 RepID=A0A9E7EMG3_9LILI|nr:cell growth defect factor 2 [Musa troglodytarum]
MSLAGGHRRGYAWALSAGLNAALAAVSAKFVPSQVNTASISFRRMELRFFAAFYLNMLAIVHHVMFVLFPLKTSQSFKGTLEECSLSSREFSNIFCILTLQFPRYGLVILFNVIMWGCYVNSLKALSSLQATVTNFAANFLTSGLAGFFLFKEPLSSQLLFLIVHGNYKDHEWFVGAFFIILGVFVLSKSSSPRKLSSD